MADRCMPPLEPSLLIPGLYIQLANDLPVEQFGGRHTKHTGSVRILTRLCNAMTFTSF